MIEEKEMAGKKQLSFVVGAVILLIAMGTVSYYSADNFTGFSTRNVLVAAGLMAGPLSFIPDLFGDTRAKCYDSDGGRNYYSPGFTRYRASGWFSKTTRETDNCLDLHTIEEFYCDGLDRKRAVYSCDKGNYCMNDFGLLQEPRTKGDACIEKGQLNNLKSQCNKKFPQYKWVEERGCLPSCGELAASKGKDWTRAICKSSCSRTETDLGSIYENCGKCCYRK